MRLSGTMGMAAFAKHTNHQIHAPVCGATASQPGHGIGSPLMLNSISSTVSRICRRLGLPKGATLHILRHSHASLLLADGVGLATVSERLGHSSVRVTAEVYAHPLRGQDDEAVRKLEEFQRASRSAADLPVGRVQ